MPHFSADLLEGDPDGAALLREILGAGARDRCSACAPTPLFAAPPPPPPNGRAPRAPRPEGRASRPRVRRQLRERRAGLAPPA
ncbi:hypothetical protein [Methylobacterium sp. WSM2598]|uniref:hypothetical protein n=1 Tax=Methylobacterium sp. WSM2598 TaxID=398261 RepID=UPI0003765660|nr:hypothetical protein [Methylobacterium sp. WSM2598]